MSISSRSGARGLERTWLKYYNIQKQQITLSLGLNAAKNTDYMEKASSKSCLGLNSLQKVNVRICLPPPGLEQGGLED